MAERLRREEIVTIAVLAEKGQNHCEIARAVGVTEGTVRYHLRRKAEGAEDGRSKRAYKAEALAGVIEHWYADREERRRPVNVEELWEHLAAEYGYGGSYRSVLRYVRARYPRPNSGPTGGWRRRRGRRRRRTGRSTPGWTSGRDPSPCTCSG